MDPYQIMGLDKNSTQSKIRKKYYELMKKHHPDKKKGTENIQCNNIIKAYKQLLDKDWVMDQEDKEKIKLGFSNKYAREQVINIDSIVICDLCKTKIKIPILELEEEFIECYGCSSLIQLKFFKNAQKSG